MDGVLFNELCYILNISKLHPSVKHLNNSACLLQDRQVKETDWHTLVQEVTFNCNSQINASTGVSPHEVMYGVRLRKRSDAVLPDSDANNFDDIRTSCAQSKHARRES